MKNAQLLLLLLLGFISIQSGCESELSKAVKGTNLALDKAIQSTEKNIKTGKTSPEIGNQVIDNLQSRKKEINESYVAIKQNPSDFSLRKQFFTKIKSTLTTLETLANLYQLDKFKAFETSRFFVPGEYIIPSKDADQILEDLNPLIEDILVVLKKDTNATAKVVIGVYGYTDEQEISTKGSLYKKLSEALNNNYPTQEELNQKLSEFRAKSLSDIIENTINQKKGINNIGKMLEFNINWLGRGYGSLPLVNMVNPKKDDERRRVVTIIWDIVPEFKR